MPPRLSPRLGSSTPTRPRINSPQPFHPPPSDHLTYKDLLLFEERLKMNAQMLGRRRRRYEVFLVSLVSAIIFLAHRVMFRPTQVYLLKLLLKGLLAVALVTLVLFFASGMYQERIVYANKYVPHANRSLRSLNMHLNLRRPPTSAWLSHWIPFIKPKISPSSPTTATFPATTTSSTSKLPEKPPLTPQSQLIPSIPPTLNPRGELIFSSRVSPHFKEGYERYRAAFERRRAEKIQEERWRRAWFWLRWFMVKPESVRAREKGEVGVGVGVGSGSGSGSLGRKEGRRLDGSVGGSRRGTPPIGEGARRSRSNSPAVYPPRSTRASVDEGNPASSLRQVGNAGNEGEVAGNGGGEKNRSRAESYSFILGKDEPVGTVDGGTSVPAPIVMRTITEEQA